MGTRRIVFAALTLALFACEQQPTSVAVDVEPAFAGRGHDHPQNRGPVSTSVTGNATFLNAMGQVRHISFTALDQRTGPGDATVVGQFQLFNRTTGRLEHGIINCFLILNGNEALIGGQIFLRGGGVLTRAFRVVDNGGPSGPTPDRITGLLRPGFAPIAGVDDEGKFCGPNHTAAELTEILAAPTFPIVAGDIQVRDVRNNPN